MDENCHDNLLIMTDINSVPKGFTRVFNAALHKQMEVALINRKKLCCVKECKINATDKVSYFTLPSEKRRLVFVYYYAILDLIFSYLIKP